MILTNPPWMFRDNRVFLLVSTLQQPWGPKNPIIQSLNMPVCPLSPLQRGPGETPTCVLWHTQAAPASEALLFWESHVRQKSIVFLHSIALVGLFGPRRNLISSRLKCTELQYVCIVPTLLASCWQGTCCPKSAGIELKIDIENAAVHSFRLCHVLTALKYHFHVSLLFL